MGSQGSPGVSLQTSWECPVASSSSFRGELPDPIRVPAAPPEVTVTRMPPTHPLLPAGQLLTQHGGRSLLWEAWPAGSVAVATSSPPVLEFLLCRRSSSVILDII